MMAIEPHVLAKLALALSLNTEPGPNGCVNWTASRSHGYGLKDFDKRRYLMHRVAWEIRNGPIPHGLHVLHSCDNPSCVNADHLSVGTHADNMRDMWSKGRGVLARRQRGEISKDAKLTSAQVAEIRYLVATGAARQAVLARRFGVSRSTINGIVKRRKWAHEPSALIEFGDSPEAS